MNPTEICWATITDRREAIQLKEFTCTTSRPRSPAGRKLSHPKPWERAAQSIIRQSPQCLKAGNLLVVGRQGGGDQIVAVAHLTFDETLPSVFAAHIAAIGVCLSVRGQGGKVADRCLAEACVVIAARAREGGNGTVLVTANIHIQNGPSQLLFERAEFEPFSIPRGDYQQWIRQL
ncbi:hypothetical protein [Nocardia sp. XZ_19_231]|uniref:hypothetical protein n=1 Tax=Nocardia sp. XZ_19_231 TaxID=2769252 RepID=UPI00188E7233|nr:hypothetical protein [Nocardia sp. XZ_19_231]